jgi:hypothetical protein
MTSIAARSFGGRLLSFAIPLDIGEIIALPAGYMVVLGHGFGGRSLIENYRFSRTAFISAPTSRVRQETKIHTMSTKNAPIAP